MQLGLTFTFTGELTNRNRVSFMIANDVARQVGYNLTEGWGQVRKPPPTTSSR